MSQDEPAKNPELGPLAIKIARLAAIRKLSFLSSRRFGLEPPSSKSEKYLANLT